MSVFPDAIVLDITQQQIDQAQALRKAHGGREYDIVTCCPINEAAKVALALPHQIHTGAHSINVWSHLGGSLLAAYALDTEAQRWQRRFDSGAHVSPFSTLARREDADKEA